MALIRKAIAAAVLGSVAWATSVVTSSPADITSGEWVQFAGVWVTVIVVWLVPNDPPTA